MNAQKTPADYVREFHRQRALQVGVEPASPATPQMATNLANISAPLAPETVRFIAQTSPETAVLLQHYGVPPQSAPSVTTDSRQPPHPQVLVDTRPAFAGIGMEAPLDHRGGMVGGAAGAFQATEEAEFEAELKHFRQGPKAEPTVINANLFTVAEFGVTGFGH